jgi:hypothetical protein
LHARNQRDTVFTRDDSVGAAWESAFCAVGRGWRSFDVEERRKIEGGNGGVFYVEMAAEAALFPVDFVSNRPESSVLGFRSYVTRSSLPWWNA